MTEHRILQAKEERGRQAEELLKHPLIQEAFIKLKGDLLNEFISTGLDNDKQRLNAWQQSQILDKFERNFESIVNTGNHAKISLLENAKSKLRNII
tara:strand:+ start:2029 stop:2316 length:288 start_codon:yes stop_codon:yes gene_type:complete